MQNMKQVGLVGARGYTGRELLKLVAAHPQLDLAFAVSRELSGTPVSTVEPAFSQISFEELSPREVAARAADILVLALPDGTGAAYMEALSSASDHPLIIDLSADYRFDRNWTYGLPELYADR